MTPDLPINAVLPDILAALGQGNGAVIIAPPGAGKTTAVAPALLTSDWCNGQIILTSPRRVAARAAAERIAELLGEPVGQRVGYITRLDTKKSDKTRILVVTEAVFVNQILSDQELDGVSAVLFDEAHERSLDCDLGLALARETQCVLREDLRIGVMSATIDGEKFAAIMGNAPVIESEGKAYPLDIRWLGSAPDLRVEDAMAKAVMTAWHEQDGDILAFLPGVREIERCRERLSERLPDTPVLPLHGQIQPADQRKAIRRDPGGKRRIVLATSIAETSLTLEGVSVVVDSGLSRGPTYDVASGLSHLVTQRASQASAAQRAGRAARTGPGVAYRLWEEAAHGGRPEFDPPEIMQRDLTGLRLSLAQWGAGDPAQLALLDPPPAAAWQSATERLTTLGALDETGVITETGTQLAKLPMEPVLASMVLFGAQAGHAFDAAKLALLLQERGLGGRFEDLQTRLERWDRDDAPRAKNARKLAARWAKLAEQQLQSDGKSPHSPALSLAKALPGNLAKRRDASGEHWISAGGRGFVLDSASPLARAEWLIIGEAQGAAKSARITAALALDFAEIERAMGERIEQRSTAKWNAREGRVEARLEKRLGAITLKSGPDPSPDQSTIRAALAEAALAELEAFLPADLVARGRYAGIAAWERKALAQAAEQWLIPLLEGKRDLSISKGKLSDNLLALLDWDTRQRLDSVAPREFASPAGTTHAIDYAGDDAPCVEVRVQALFGLDQHPMIGTVPLLLKLTSPAGRPIQSTRDLPAFWRGSWADVCKDMKGRYPKHRWPDEPWTEKPSLKTKNAFNRT